MNLDFEDANISVTSSEILEKITEEDIFRRYINNFQEIEKSFCSELRVDKNPSCRITNKYGMLYYRDFGIGQSLDCWNYVMVKFNCNYYECLNIIANDFNIKKLDIRISPRVILSNDGIKPLNIIKERAKLEIIRQPWTVKDVKYWGQYLIPLEMLDFYDVVSAKKTLLYKDGKRYIFTYSNSKPRYGYIFKNGVKAYSPYGDKMEKWMYTCNGDVIEGYQQLDYRADVLIITKGLKDVIDYRLLDVNAIALPSETSKLKKELVDELSERYNNIIINLDNDQQGVESTNKLVAEYGFKSYYIDKEKDLSDWIKKNKSLKKAKKMIDGKIKGCF